MLRAVQTFNRRLLAGLGDEEIEELRTLLAKLEHNARVGRNANQS
jgi:DNA-binding MarR family transcriptional regulator